MIDDIGLREGVLEELDWSPTLDATHVTVVAKDGAVALGGHVRTFAERLEATRAAHRVDGVKAVANDVEVRLDPPLCRSDADVAESIAHVLRSNVTLAESEIRAEVRDGVVTLTGTVDWHHQRQHVEAQVAHVNGVREIRNRVGLRRGTRAVDVRERIERALARHAGIAADRIEVRVDDDRVVLDGEVDTLRERAIAEGAAWSAPGVREVIDAIRVV